MFKDEGRDSLIIIFIMIKMVLVSPCSTTGAGRRAGRADWNEEEAPGHGHGHVYHGRGHGHVYQGTFTVEVWIFF